MTPEQIKHMVDRFLGWKLPDNFAPDAGISFKPVFNEHTPWPSRHEPVGTNLFDAQQAEAMIRHLIEGLPSADAYERGRRDMLNALLALNPAAAAKVADAYGQEPDAEGRLPFDVVLWVATVAEQLGIEPLDTSIQT